MFPFSPILFEVTVLGIILGIVLVLYVVMSFVFSYHWKRFAIPTALFQKMKRLYFLLSGTLAIVSVLLFVSIIETL